MDAGGMDAAATPGPATADSSQQAASQVIHRYDDDFMMYVFKVEMCKRIDKHDRGKCPYAHPGELARRRHPSLYQALPCPEARAKKICPRLENCNCSHSTFEFWLHPDRFKTFLCERGDQCNRPVCFFAHSPSELRELPQGLQRTDHVQRPSGVTSSSTLAQANPVPSSSSQTAETHLLQLQHGGHDLQVLAESGHLPRGQVLYRPLSAVPGEPAACTSNLPARQALQAQVVGQPAHAAAPVQPPAPPAPAGALERHQSQVFATGSSTQQQQMPGHTPAPQPGSQSRLQYGYQQQQPGQLADRSSAQQQMPAGLLPGQHGPPQPPPGQPQLFVAYQPVMMPGGPSSTSGVLMMRPPQRGSTVAVLPAGPSTWQGSNLAEFPSEAPSLETLCAAMNRMAVPLSDAAGSQQLLQQWATQQEVLQHPQQQQPPQQQQQQLVTPDPPAPQHFQQVAVLSPDGQQQVLMLAVPVGQTPQQQQQQQQQPLMQQQHLPMLVTAAAPLQPPGYQVGQVGPQAVQQTPFGQLLPDQQVVVLMGADGPAQVGWPAVQPGL